MPHVVVEGPATLAQPAGSFSPLEKVSTDHRIKIADLFLNTRKTSPLLPCVVVEHGVVYRFCGRTAPVSGGLARGSPCRAGRNETAEAKGGIPSCPISAKIR